MADIKEVIEDVKDKVGDKGIFFIIAVIVVVFIIMLLKDSSGESSNSTYIVPTGYTSYPDAVTNANVIIDEVNKNSDYNTETILDAMEESKVSIDEQFSFTNDYMAEGFETIQNGMTGLESNMDSLMGTVGNINTNVNKIQGTVTNNQSILNNLKDKIGSINASSSSGSVGSSSASSYYAKSSYKGVSIVDAFKSIGVYSIGGKKVDDWTSRKAIAEANGIKNYTGTASQNSKLLSLLKTGKLKKA